MLGIAMMAVLRRAMSMKCISVYLLFATAIQGLCSADVTRLAADDRKVLGDASRFHEVHSTSDLPSAIVALCAGDGGKIAEPDQKWNATDAIIDPSLPGKRLIWATAGGDYYVVHYERGGIAHTFHVLIAKLVKPKVIWSAVWRSVQGLCSVSRCAANRQTGRPLGLWAMSCF